MLQVDSIFAGGNKQVHGGDYSAERGLVAFGSAGNIALWDPLDYSGVKRLLRGHKADVTVVSFVPESDLLVSGSEDRELRVWQPKADSVADYECIQEIPEHEGSISCICFNETGRIMCVGCADGQLSVWWRDESTGKFTLMEKLTIQYGFLPLVVCMREVPGAAGSFILAIGGTKSQILVYNLDVTDGVLNSCKHSTTLEGHEDWVKCLDFRKEGEHLYLASGSQDRYIRLWKVETLTVENFEKRENEKKKENLILFLSTKQHKFTVRDSHVCSITFEALLMGHDDWVSSLKWHPIQFSLMSCSADTSLMVWNPDESSGVWVCSTRLGELSIKGASTATGAAGGFWCSLWCNEGSQQGNVAAALGKTGSWRVWREVTDHQSGVAEWEPMTAPTGHFKPCTDVAWESSGCYLLSTSSDQTTRLYAPWKLNIDGKARSDVTWHEFSRPQIHGYDMVCVASLQPNRFVSGGEEKILRVFEEPKGVSNILSKFCGIESQLEENAMPESAALPALGLSNKAEFENETIAVGGNGAVTDSPEDETPEESKNVTYEILRELKTPPLEDHLQRHTLWPETEKLYGHGYEITSVEATHDKSLIATTCRSNNATHAVIRNFETTTWQELKPSLYFHTLTVTRLRFSGDDRFLLSVGRDRQWAVWMRKDGNQYEKVAENAKGHSRIIWDGSFLPIEFGESDEYYFVTGSRDKTFKLWKMVGDTNGGWSVSLLHTVKTGEFVTAVDIHPAMIHSQVYLAIGLDDGSIRLYTISKNDESVVVNQVSSLEGNDCFAGRVNRVAWRPEKEPKSLLTFAAAGEDHSVRIFSVDTEKTN